MIVFGQERPMHTAENGRLRAFPLYAEPTGISPLRRLYYLSGCSKSLKCFSCRDFRKYMHAGGKFPPKSFSGYAHCALNLSRCLWYTSIRSVFHSGSSYLYFFINRSNQIGLMITRYHRSKIVCYCTLVLKHDQNKTSTGLGITAKAWSYELCIARIVRCR